MANKDNSKKTKPKAAPHGGDIHVGGSVTGDHIVVGSHNVINHYYQVVEKNTKQNDPDHWNLKHPYPMPPNFTGRIDERAMLAQWLDGDSENRLFILRALGGFGKSALAWQWLTHDVNPKTWKKVVFWSFYEGDTSFDHFAEEMLNYLKRDVPQGKRDQVDALLHAMQADKILLIMDGFERALRVYSSMNAAYQGNEEPKLDDNQLDCVDVNAEAFLKSICSLPKIQSKVLMTTRLTPRAVKPRGEFMVGCREFELTAMQKADAVQFFHKQGVKGNRAEIEAACEPYGYHPLSLRLLAGRIVKDFQNPGDISVAQKLKIDGDIIQQKHQVLEVSYNSVSEPEQKLLSTIACFRSPVEYQTIQSISENKDTLDADLNDLIERGLMNFDAKAKKFDLHPIVRRYAYDRLTAPERTGVHAVLIVYFDAVPKPQKVEKLEDLDPVIELYHHTVRAGKLDEAIVLFRDRLSNPLYFQLGAYQLVIELLRALFLDGEDKPPRLKDEAWQAWTLNTLASAYSLSGQPRRAVPLFEMTNDIYENKMKNKKYLAIGLGAVAKVAQLPLGKLKQADRNFHRQVEIGLEIEDEFKEATGHQELGRVLSYRGAWQEAEQELNSTISIQQKIKHVQTEGISHAYRALRFLLMARTNPQSQIENLKSSIKCAQRALELADEDTKQRYPHPRDYVRAYWLLGAAYRANNELDKAEENLTKALNLCRQINMVDHEADILLELARLRYAQGDFKDAQAKAAEALVITERSGYVLQGADVNLFLAQYALEQEKDKVKAKEYAEKAKKLATGWEEIDGKVVYDTTGKYVYRVAYDEAEAMLEKLK